MNLETIDDLKPAPYNPRTISPDALHGLRQSVERFGDLSGIVWNARSGHLVAGHQRVKALTDAGATFDPSPPRLVLGDRAFPVRVVDWDDATERAANITANNPHISGEFNDGLAGLLDDLRDFDGFDALRLDALLAIDIDMPEDDAEGIVPEPDPNIILRVSVPAAVWLGKRGEILEMVGKIERAYSAKIQVNE